MLAPVGRPRGAQLQRRPARGRDARPQRPAPPGACRRPTTGWLPPPRRPARCRSRPPRDPARRRLGPGEILLVDPRRGTIHLDTTPRRGRDAMRQAGADADAPRAGRVADRGGRGAHRPTRSAGARRPRRGAAPARHQDHGARGPRAALEHGRRHADGRHGPARPAGRRPPPPDLRAGHQPADRPGAGAGRHGPRGRARSPRSAARRPPGADRDRCGSPPVRRRPRTRLHRTHRVTSRPSARRDLEPGRAGPAGLEQALDAARDRGRRGRRDRRGRGPRHLRPPLSTRAGSAAGRPGRRSRSTRALTDAGLRGRTDLLVDAADVLDVHAAGDGPGGRRDRHRCRGWRSSSRPRSRMARRRGRDPRGGDRQPARRHSRPACARCSPGWASARSPPTSAGRCSRSLELAPELVEPGASRPRPRGPGRIGFAALAERSLRRARDRQRRWPQPASRAAGRPRLCAVPGRRRAPPLRAADREGGAGLAAADRPSGRDSDYRGACGAGTPPVVRDGLRDPASARHSRRSRSPRWSRPGDRPPLRGRRP